MKWKGFARNRVARQTALHTVVYAMIAIVVAGCAVLVISYNSINALQEQLDDTFQSVLTSQMRLLETSLLEMERVALQIESDTTTSAAKLSQHGYDVYQVTRQMQKYISANLYFQDILIYSPETRMIISSGGTYTPEIYCKTRMNSDALEAFFNDFHAYASPNMRLFGGTSAGAQMQLFVYCLPSLSTHKERAVVFVAQKEMTDALFESGMRDTDSNLSIFDRGTGELLYQYDPTHAPPDWAAIEPMSANGANVVLSGAPCILLDAQRQPWRVVYQVDNRLYADKLERIQWVGVMAMAVAALLSLALGAYLASHNAKPWKRLLLKVGGEDAQREPSDVVGYIANRIDDVVKRNGDLVREVSQYTDILRDYRLLRLLSGRLTNEELRQHFYGGAQRQEAERRFCVAYALPDDAAEQAEVDRWRERVTHAENGASAQSVLWPDGAVALLICFTDARAELPAYCASIAELARFPLFIGASGCSAELSAARQMLYQAIAACEYARFSGDAFACYSQLTQAGVPDRAAYDDLRERLLQALSTANRQQATACVSQFIAEQRKRGEPPASARVSCITLFNDLIRLGDDMGFLIGGENLYWSEIFDSLASFNEWLTTYCNGLMDEVDRRRDMERDDLLHKALRFIDDHCLSTDFSLQRMADALMVSQSYMIRHFKAKMTITPGRYVENLRLDRAAKLLRDTDTDVKDIVRQVGYYDNSSFIRKFREREGMTPGQYRTVNRLQL